MGAAPHHRPSIRYFPLDTFLALPYCPDNDRPGDIMAKKKAAKKKKKK
jgi:hypothetical protein